MHRHDVGVIQLGDRLRLAEHPRPTLRAQTRRIQDLDRHIPVQNRIMRAVHDTHASAAELVAEFVAIVEYSWAGGFTHRLGPEG